MKDSDSTQSTAEPNLQAPGSDLVNAKEAPKYFRSLSPDFGEGVPFLLLTTIISHRIQARSKLFQNGLGEYFGNRG